MGLKTNTGKNMTEKTAKINAKFHFLDGTMIESELSVNSGEPEDIMISISDQVGKYNVLAFLDKKFTSKQFLIVRENIKAIEFFPIEENKE